MAANKVGYGSANIATERARMGYTGNVWLGQGGSAFPFDSVREDWNLGVLLHSNFLAWVGGAVASNLANYNTESCPFHSWETTGASIKTLATDFPVGVTGSLLPPAVGLAMGAIELATGATAHASVCIEPGGSANGASANGMFALPSSAAATAPIYSQLPKLFFEARVRFPQSANGAFFVGMAKPNSTSAINTMFSGADAFVNQAAIGFAVNPIASTGFATSGTKIQPFYATATAATVANQTGFTGSVGGIPSTADYIGATQTPAVTGLLTDWTKLGFVFDATRPDSICLKFYQDGVFLAQQTLSQIVAANWPSDVQLTPTIYAQCATAATQKIDVDWIAAGQILSIE